MAFTADKVRQGVQQAAAGGYSVDNSLRFNDDDSAYLSRTPSSAGNRKTWTLSCWVKLGNLGITRDLMSTISGDEDVIRFSSSDTLQIMFHGGTYGYLATTQVFRDTSAWYHIIVSIDTTLSTAGNRIRLYVNGIEVTDFTSNTNPSQDYQTYINSTSTQYLSKKSNQSKWYHDGYLAEVHFIDGQALDPTSFGETGTYGEWKPIEVTGMTYGTNGFYLDFSNSGSLGTDASSNTNNWTVNNLAATDQMLDSPTNNFCTWNPIADDNTIVYYYEGNLETKGDDASWGGVHGTFLIPDDGKWYWEALSYKDAAGSGASNAWTGIGISTAVAILNGNENTSGDVNLYADNGYTKGKGGYVDQGTEWSEDDVIGVAYNATAGTIAFYKNNSLIVTLSGGDVLSSDINGIVPVTHVAGS